MVNHQTVEWGCHSSLFCQLVQHHMFLNRQNMDSKHPNRHLKKSNFEYSRSQNIKQIIRIEPNYSNRGCHLKNQILKSPWRKYQITRYKEFCKITFHYWTFIILFKALREPHIWNLFQCTLIEEIRTLLLHLFQLY